MWTSILSALESVRTFDDLRTLCTELSECMPPLKPRVKALCMSSDKIDMVGQAKIPPDGPVPLKALKTGSDKNCLCRALRHGYFNDKSCHIELRVHIIVEGVLHMEHYLSDECLERGASILHQNADLPTVFETFSEYYSPGQ